MAMIEKIFAKHGRVVVQGSDGANTLRPDEAVQRAKALTGHRGMSDVVEALGKAAHAAQREVDGRGFDTKKLDHMAARSLRAERALWGKR